MARETAIRSLATTSGLRLGERLRQLRVAAGLTQSELAGERFSKEYVSQIERGKTRPTAETIEWLAVRLGVDPGFLANGVATDERGRLNEALSLAERSGMPSDSLRSNILSWRSRCWRRMRDYEAAREDIERALQLAEDADDPRTIGAAYFQASLVADREGHWVLARSYAERARAAYEELSDKVHVGQLANNLGALNFQLGNPDKAIVLLKEAFGIALETGRDADAAQAVSSLAQIHLRTGNVDQAEEQARHALRLLETAGNEDYLDEVGSAQLVLGRALLEQDRLDEAEDAFAAAEASLGQLGSASHRAAAWVARGDLAARRGDDRLAAHLYRTAAEALQDVRF